MKTVILFLSLVALFSNSTAFATCVMPDGSSNDGTLSAPGMLPDCGPDGKDVPEVNATLPTPAINDSRQPAPAINDSRQPATLKLSKKITTK